MRGAVISLRPYQRAALDAVRVHYRAGKRRILLVCPTGGGKTATASELVRSWCTKTPGARAVWASHRSELRDQAAETLTRAGCDVGHSGADAGRPVQVVSLQGVLARGETPAAGLVIADESHHFVGAPEWGRFLFAYPEALVVGLTATPERADGRGLGEFFEVLHVVAQPRELVAAGHLVDCEIIRPGRVQAPGHLAQRPVDAYVQHAKGRRNIVFASTVKHAQEFAADFLMAGIQARVGGHAGVK